MVTYHPVERGDVFPIYGNERAKDEGEKIKVGVNKRKGKRKRKWRDIAQGFLSIWNGPNT